MRRHFLKGKKGVTLVEVIVSIAILSLIVVFIISVFVTALDIIGDNARIKKQSKNAAAGVENKMGGFEPDSDITETGEQGGNMTITFGGNTLDITGNYISGRDKNNNVTYRYFSPD